MNYKFNWKIKENRYSNGKSCFVGRVNIGSVNWDRIKADDPPYSAYCRLPGIKEKLGRFDTEEQGMKKIEHAFTYFIKMLEQDETNP